MSYESAAVVRPVLARLQKIRPFSLPGVTGDKVLHGLFPYHSLPHYVWIDGEGALLAVTEEKEVTGANINRVLLGKGLVGHEPLAGQYIAFLCHDQAVYRPYTHLQSTAVKGKERNFKLGSEWLYLKIYCTPLSADRILTEVLAPVLDKCRSLWHNWFFIRYTDPAYHLRLRFRVKDRDGVRLLTLLERQLKMSGTEHMVKELQGDTYRRELERYPAGIIDEVEKLFRIGSEYVLRSLRNRLSGSGVLSEFDTGMITALGMAVGYVTSPEELMLFFSARSESFLTEFKADKKMRLDLDLKFRELRPGLEKLNLPDLLSGSKSPLTQDLEEIIRQMGVICRSVAGWPGAGREQLLADLVHMQLNRIFCTAQRRQELLVCFCLHKFLCSWKARRG